MYFNLNIIKEYMLVYSYYTSKYDMFVSYRRCYDMI